MTLFIRPLPNIFLTYIERAGDVAHKIGDQQPVGFVTGAPFRWVQMTDDLAALIGKHDDQRVLDPEGPRLGHLRPQQRPAVFTTRT